MATSAIDKFITSSYQNANIQFDDKKLEKIATELNEPLAKVTDEIVQYLLMNFSLNYGNLVCGLSDKLYNRYREHVALYSSVIEAMNEGGNVEAIPQFQEYLETLSAYGPVSKTRLIEEVKLKAFLSHDIIRTFPHRCKCTYLEKKLLDETFFEILDGTQALYERLTITPLFFKYIAVYSSPNKFLTWNDLGMEWAKINEGVRTFLTFKKNLPLNWLTPVHIPDKPDRQNLTFKKFTYHKTRESFEALLKTQLGHKTRTEIENGMEDEGFRMDLVFYTGNPTLLHNASFECTDSVRPWLLAARRLLRINSKYQFSKDRGPNLFRWIFKSESEEKVLKQFDEFSTLNEIPEKAVIDNYINQISRLETLLNHSEVSDSLAFTFFLLMIRTEPEAIKHAVDQIDDKLKEKFLKAPLETFKDLLTQQSNR